MDVGPLGLLIAKMPERGRVEVEAVEAELTALRTAFRMGPTAEEAMLVEG